MKIETGRPKPRARFRILTAAGLLAVTFAVVRFADIDLPHSPAVTADSNTAAALPLSAPLALPSAPLDPNTPAARPAEVEPRPVAVAGPAPAASEQPAAAEMAVTALPAEPAPEVPAPIIATSSAPSLLASAEADSDIVADMPPMEEPAAATELTASVESETAPRLQWTEHQVQKGESLARIFAQQGLDASLLHRIVTSGKEAKSLADIRPGQRLRFQFDENKELSRLELHRNRVESLRVAIADDEITVEEISKAVEKRVASAAGLIESSLFVDGQKAGLSDGQIMEMATIFGWDIDFALEIRAGDGFRVLFEEHYLDGEKLRSGPILAAEFTNRGTTYRAIRYEDSSGELGYFDADGHSKRRAFIRTPIKFARVSSGYNPRRWHPVLKKWRSHKGVDYVAPTGTPVRASGDGRVVFRGTKGGYGKTVILEHAGKYTTLYAHLSKYSSRAKSGNRVKQGQVIGYVGKTGLATGPHLHYEFRVRGQHQDPLRVKLPKSLSLPKSEIPKFQKTAAPLLAQLESIQAETMVASAEATTRP